MSVPRPVPWPPTSTPSSTFHGAGGGGAAGAPAGALAPPRPAPTVHPVRSLPLKRSFHGPGDWAEIVGDAVNDTTIVPMSAAVDAMRAVCFIECLPPE